MWVGAGLSFEAGIKTGNDICDDIKKQLSERENTSEPYTWALDNLDWDDLSRRYSKCISRLGNARVRIDYFRQIVRGIQPSFSHHAVALLMRRGWVASDCLTTNFDKLLE